MARSTHPVTVDAPPEAICTTRSAGPGLPGGASGPARCGRAAVTPTAGHYAVVLALVLLVNLLPAFGPPIWVVLVLFKLNWHLNPVALVIAGAPSPHRSPHRTESPSSSCSCWLSYSSPASTGPRSFSTAPITTARPRQ